MVENIKKESLEAFLEDLIVAKKIFGKLESFGLTEDEIDDGTIALSNVEEGNKYWIVPYPFGYGVFSNIKGERAARYIPDEEISEDAYLTIKDFTSDVVGIVDSDRKCKYDIKTEDTKSLTRLDLVPGGIAGLRERFQRISDMKGE